MQHAKNITTLFIDIGGVLLTNGWDHNSRTLAAQTFKIDPVEFEERHRLSFEIYEEGKISLDEYLDLVIFHHKRSFKKAKFQQFMFAQSKPYPEMIQLINQLKKQYHLKIIVVSNEARELNLFRIQQFGLNRFVDAFMSSCFVGLRKPNAEIFKRSLDIVQAPKEQIIYIENTPMFVEVAEGLGLNSILHIDYESTCEKLALFGLQANTLQESH